MSTEKNVSNWYSCISFGNTKSKMVFSPQGLEEFQRHQSSREQVIRNDPVPHAYISLSTPERAIKPDTMNADVYHNYVSQFTSTESVPKKVAGVVKELFEQDWNVDAVDVYAKAVGMDDANKNILKIFKTHGPEAAFEAMTTRDDGTPMSYAESRAIYG